MKTAQLHMTLLATLMLVGTACTKKSKFEAPQPNQPQQQQSQEQGANGEEVIVVTGEKAPPVVEPQNLLQTPGIPVAEDKYNPLSEPAHVPIPQVIPVEGVQDHLPLGGKKNITTVTITGARSALVTQSEIIETTGLKQGPLVSSSTSQEVVLVSTLYDRLLPENLQENSDPGIPQAPPAEIIESAITLVIYKDQLDTIALEHAPTVTRSEYVRSGLAVLEKNHLTSHKKILGYVKDGVAYYEGEGLENPLTAVDIAKIVGSGACDLSENYGPCVLVRKERPVSIVIGVIKEGQQTNVYYDDFSEDVELIGPQNALLSAFNLETALYSPKLLNPPLEEPQAPVVETVQGKKVWGRCSIDADLEIEKVSFLLSFEKGVGYGKAICRYNNGTVKSENIKITLKSFGLGFALDFKQDPFKTVQHVSVKASGLGYTPNVKDLACKYSAIGADATIFGLGLGVDTGVIGSNSTLNEDITVTGCKEGTGALAFTFQAIDAEGFQFSVTPLEFKSIYIEIVE